MVGIIESIATSIDVSNAYERCNTGKHRAESSLRGASCLAEEDMRVGCVHFALSLHTRDVFECHDKL